MILKDPFQVTQFVTRDYAVSLRRKYNVWLKAGNVPRGNLTTDTSLSNLIPLEEVTVLAEKVATVLRFNFQELPKLKIDYIPFTRIHTGGHHPLHADSLKLDGSPNHTPTRVATAMLYLTEEGVDHAGGCIVFPEMNLTVAPQAGLLVGFMTGIEHRHEVTPVTEGTRDAIAFWYTQQCVEENGS